MSKTTTEIDRAAALATLRTMRAITSPSNLTRWSWFVRLITARIMYMNL
nr:MAG TPA: hypothetical protein [Caudoviricetes sp.]